MRDLRTIKLLCFKEENLELRDFVSQSIAEIVEGIVDAQKRLENSDTTINPALYNVFSGSQSGGTNLALGWDKENNLVSTINFDVAVTVNDGTETKGTIGVVAGMFALGSQGKSSQSNQSISRLQFKVPISLPKALKK